MKVTVHKAAPGSRRVQLQTFFDSLEKYPSGYLTKESRARWLRFLDAFGVCDSYAKAIMKGRDEATAERAAQKELSRIQEVISFLEQNGYTVTKNAEGAAP